MPEQPSKILTPAQPNLTPPDAFLETRPNPTPSPHHQSPITNYQSPITHQSLNQLANQALQISLTSPRQGWQLIVDVEAAIQFQKDDFLAAKAAWHHGRLANEYGRPILAHAALDRAEQLFTALNEPGWKAAVLWQRHALPWASANLATAIQALETAAVTLENSPNPLSTFVPHCRLSLAYAKLLKGSFNGLPELLQQCLDYFTETNDLLLQARTHFVHSGYLRRTAPYEQAKAASLRGLELAQAANAAADIARFHLQIGFNHWLGDGNFEAASESFKTAADEFQALDMPGWLAQSQDGLAQVYIMIGRLAEATALIENALTIFRDEAIIGQQPPTLFTASWVERQKGNHHQSLDYLKQAEAGYEAVGNDKMIPVVQTGLGDTYMQLGRFQQSLQNLERAYGRLETLNLQDRLAECALRLARLWTRLGNPKQARHFLKQSKKHAQKAGHASALMSYYLRSAEFFNNQEQTVPALSALTKALRLAQSQDNPKMEALCRRQLAENYCQQHQFEKAAEQLTQAETSIKAMGLGHEQAACLLIWGAIYRQQGQPGQAIEAWEAAEQFSRDIMPDLNWQAAAALAELAEESGNKSEALDHYRQMIASLRLLRQGFWQPELAGGYLKRPSAFLNRAVLLAAQNGRHQDTLLFIEETKAQATARRLQAEAFFQEFDSIPHPLQNIVAEIRWLQKNLRDSDAWPFAPFRSADYESKCLQLREKIDAYTEQLNRLEREKFDNAQLPLNNGFNLEQFRHLAEKHLGTKWAALDYYRDDSQLVCFLLTPTAATAYPIHLSDDLGMAIESLNRPYNHRTLPFPILRDAGHLLLPAAVRENLLEGTTLIIAPHRSLHRLPWAALHLDGPTYRPLVAAATPVIVPSLQTLSLLWQREEKEAKKANGLLLAVSDFEGRHPNLPAVRREVQELAPILGQNGRILLNQESTAAALLSELAGKTRYDFWHISSHAFHDDHSGHLSGLALYERDFWLDELWQLAPLPPLVIFSACGGSKGHIIEGDEHIGLTTTCLTAGANHVVGSIWDISDAGVPDIMVRFYSRLLAPQNGTAVPVSKALAEAQRHAWETGQSWQQWAGFRCTGRP